MASLLSIVFALIVAPAVVLGDYCGYLQFKDCFHTPDLNHVCGTNGQTYRNYCLLAKAYCKDNSISKAHDGDCASVSTTPIPIDGSEIALDIFCTDIAYIDCPTTGPAVCGSDGKNYINMCEFDKGKCTHRDIHPNGTTCTTSTVG